MVVMKITIFYFNQSRTSKTRIRKKYQQQIIKVEIIQPIREPQSENLISKVQ